jgi:hypothetical protein
MNLTEKQRTRFAANIARGEPGACWEWRGNRDGCRYGKFFASRYVGAHRLAWMLARGEIPTGLHVLHRCDNPPCCNPEHLFLGTMKDNCADMVAKGRGNRAKGARHGRHTHPEATARGERSGTAKLTDQQVEEIRNSQDDALTLARRFAVSRTHIYRVVKKESR